MERSRNKEYGKLSFSLMEFRQWFEQNGNTVFNQWCMSSWEKEMRPSVDRINPLGKYTFENMQVLTAKENRKKGDHEKEILWGKAVRQEDMSGKLVALYPSIKIAVRATGFNQSLISMACNGLRKQTGGYKWSFVIGNIYEKPELLSTT